MALLIKRLHTLDKTDFKISFPVISLLMYAARYHEGAVSVLGHLQLQPRKMFNF